MKEGQVNEVLEETEDFAGRQNRDDADTDKTLFKADSLRRIFCSSLDDFKTYENDAESCTSGIGSKNEDNSDPDRYNIFNKGHNRGHSSDLKIKNGTEFGSLQPEQDSISSDEISSFIETRTSCDEKHENELDKNQTEPSKHYDITTYINHLGNCITTTFLCEYDSKILYWNDKICTHVHIDDMVHEKLGEETENTNDIFIGPKLEMNLGNDLVLQNKQQLRQSLLIERLFLENDLNTEPCTCIQKRLSQYLGDYQPESKDWDLLSYLKNKLTEKIKTLKKLNKILREENIDLKLKSKILRDQVEDLTARLSKSIRNASSKLTPSEETAATSKIPDSTENELGNQILLEKEIEKKREIITSLQQSLSFQEEKAKRFQEEVKCLSAKLEEQALKNEVDKSKKEVAHLQDKLTDASNLCEELKSCSMTEDHLKEENTNLKIKLCNMKADIAIKEILLTQSNEKIDNLEIKVSQTMEESKEMIESLKNDVKSEKENVTFLRSEIKENSVKRAEQETTMRNEIIKLEAQLKILTEESKTTLFQLQENKSKDKERYVSDLEVIQNKLTSALQNHAEEETKLKVRISSLEHELSESRNVLASRDNQLSTRDEMIESLESGLKNMEQRLAETITDKLDTTIEENEEEDKSEKTTNSKRSFASIRKNFHKRFGKTNR